MSEKPEKRIIVGRGLTQALATLMTMPLPDAARKPAPEVPSIREIPLTAEMMEQYDKPLSEILKEQEFEVFQAGFELGRKTVHLTVIDAWHLHYHNERT